MGRQLRAAARPRPAPELPQPPSAADPPRPVHGAQQAAVLPNWVSAGARGGGLAGLAAAAAGGLGVSAGEGCASASREDGRRGGLEKPLIWGKRRSRWGASWYGPVTEGWRGRPGWPDMRRAGTCGEKRQVSAGDRELEREGRCSLRTGDRCRVDGMPRST